MRVNVEFNPANMRRFGKVWVAKVTAWRVGEIPVLQFGVPLSDDIAEVEADPGDLVRYGRRDLRGRQSVSEIGIVASDGNIDRVTLNKARQHWEARQRDPANPPPAPRSLDEQLAHAQDEIAKLRAAVEAIVEVAREHIRRRPDDPATQGLRAVRDLGVRQVWRKRRKAAAESSAEG